MNVFSSPFRERAGTVQITQRGWTGLKGTQDVVRFVPDFEYHQGDMMTEVSRFSFSRLTSFIYVPRNRCLSTTDIRRTSYRPPPVSLAGRLSACPGSIRTWGTFPFPAGGRIPYRGLSPWIPATPSGGWEVLHGSPAGGKNRACGKPSPRGAGNADHCPGSVCATPGREAHRSCLSPSQAPWSLWRILPPPRDGPPHSFPDA